QALVRKSIVSAWVGVISMVERRVTHRCTGTSFHHCGTRSSRIRPYTTPPYTFFAPGKAPRSSRTTSRPARASSSAAADPAGPAPTTTASTVIASSGMTHLFRQARRRRHAQPLGQFGKHCRGVGDDPQVGHPGHGAGRVGVHAHHVLRRAEPADMLCGAGNTERHV